MGFWSGVRNRIGKAFLAESAGSSVDEDELLYRPLHESADANDPLDGIRRDRMRRIARVQYYRNAIGGSLPDNLVARVIGAGAQWKAVDPEVQEVADRFVHDPDNDLPQFLPPYATELLVYGELILPIYLTPANADVRLGYLLPDQVETVIFRRGDAKRPVAVLQKAPVGEPQRLWIIPHPDPAFDNRYPPHPALTAAEEPDSLKGEDGLPVALPMVGDQVLPEIQELLDKGDVIVSGYTFYHRSGSLVSGRGRSIYERVADWLKAVDDFFFGLFRNAILQGSFIWWVKLIGGQDEAVKKRAAQLSRPPKPGSILVTNDKEEWNAVAPALSPAAQIRELLTGGLKLIGLAVGIPGHEMGAEDDTNRSTAKESRSVSINRAKRFQRQIGAMVGTWLGYQVDQKVHAKQLEADVDRTIEVVLPELDQRDETEAVTALQATVNAAVTAVDRELLLQKDARAAVYRSLGMDVPSEEDFQTALAKERDGRDEDFLARHQPVLLKLLKGQGQNPGQDPGIPKGAEA